MLGVSPGPCAQGSHLSGLGTIWGAWYWTYLLNYLPIPWLSFCGSPISPSTWVCGFCFNISTHCPLGNNCEMSYLDQKRPCNLKAADIAKGWEVALWKSIWATGPAWVRRRSLWHQSKLYTVCSYLNFSTFILIWVEPSFCYAYLVNQYNAIFQGAPPISVAYYQHVQELLALFMGPGSAQD